jgi:hypothetical protein
LKPDPIPKRFDLGPAAIVSTPEVIEALVEKPILPSPKKPKPPSTHFPGCTCKERALDEEEKYKI